MAANTQKLKGSWNEFLGKVKERWGALTDDDLKIAEGDLDQLIGQIQKRTGETRNAISKALGDMTEYGENLTNRAARTASDMAEYVGESMHEGSRYLRDQGSYGYEQARRWVRDQPTQSVAVIFGLGIGLGLLFGLSMRSK